MSAVGRIVAWVDRCERGSRANTIGISNAAASSDGCDVLGHRVKYFQLICSSITEKDQWSVSSRCCGEHGPEACVSSNAILVPTCGDEWSGYNACGDDNLPNEISGKDVQRCIADDCHCLRIHERRENSSGIAICVRA